MSLSCPGKVCLQQPSRISHNLADASQAPDTNVRISGDKLRDITSPVCPRNEVTCWPVSISHKALKQEMVIEGLSLRGVRVCHTRTYLLNW